MKMYSLKILNLVIALTAAALSVAQTPAASNAPQNKQTQANAIAYQANSLAEEGNDVEAEMQYRKALSTNPDYATGSYNLAHTYLKNGNTDEALFRLQEAVKLATSKDERHKAFHNIGNVLMENKRCKEAVEAYKNALRNNPSDEESRYNLGLAKECAEQQQDDNKDDNKDKDKNDKDNQDQNKDDQDQQDEDQKKDEEDKKDQNQDGGDKDKKEGDDEQDDEGKPKDDKKDPSKNGDNGDKKDQPQKPKQGQLSPQQVKNLLEAMSDQEAKVQEKINARKQKGAKVKTEKDW